MDIEASLVVVAGILFLLLIIFGLALKRVRKKQIPSDYFALFITSIVWIGLSIAIANYKLLIIGVIFLVIALLNKGKWKANRQVWKKFSRKELVFHTCVLAVFALMLLFVFYYYYLASKGVITIKFGLLRLFS